MSFERTELAIPGCYEITPPRHVDARGSFVKLFHHDIFAGQGLETDYREEYYTVSEQGVIRGLHFQVPPADHVKLVCCLEGRVLDALVDLRVGSPSYGRHVLLTLTPEKANCAYIPAGIAHGFCALSPKTIMLYKVSTVYSPEHDRGILWNSVGIPWPVEQPVISQRDADFPPLAQFQSPFSYAP
ncbi:MAG: dTDP-4-dehydrorhamnose 3,5-epimerase family protein [Deltaproteobacteria bacterium]|nr:dTDP-4-dehydrorhamnose 3,5-epimerase family protein [Deltaproteobacteria bacterium]